MYLQITTKCNMRCRHCGFSCNGHGKHMDMQMFYEARKFVEEYDGTEGITIGGGEPTLHPRFFDILRYCLWAFNYTWMATNGSKTKVMFRLANIIDGVDYPEEYDEEDYDGEFLDGSNGKLVVALSQDQYHSPIDQRVVDLWKRRQHKRGMFGNSHTGFEIRNVDENPEGPINAGRAKRNGISGRDDDCVCSGFLIQPDGYVRMCGCKKAPIIGSVWGGIDSDWQKKIREDQGYQEWQCFRKFGKMGKDELLAEQPEVYGLGTGQSEERDYGHSPDL